VILACMSKAPRRITIVPGDGLGDIPQLSQEDERFLTGLISAVRGLTAPSTLKCGSSSIIDLTFYACWNLAAARLVNDKTRRGTIHPSVLPEKPIRGGRASEYLSQRFSALKATLGSGHAYLVDTLERVVKIWSEVASAHTQRLLLQTKLPWGLVLSKGGEFKVKKLRKGKADVTIRQLVTPTNPKESAWLLPAERKYMSHLAAPVWGRLSEFQKEWSLVKAEDSHPFFDSFVDRVRLAYKEMHRLSESSNKRLGQRKAVILNSPEIQKLSKKDLKKAKTNELVLTFSKTNLDSLPRGAKAVFEPLYACQSFGAAEELWDMLKGARVTDAFTAYYQSLVEAAAGRASLTELIKWEKWWLDSFNPPAGLSFRDIPSNVIETSNMYEVLGTE